MYRLIDISFAGNNFQPHISLRFNTDVGINPSLLINLWLNSCQLIYAHQLLNNLHKLYMNYKEMYMLYWHQVMIRISSNKQIYFTVVFSDNSNTSAFVKMIHCLIMEKNLQISFCFLSIVNMQHSLIKCVLFFSIPCRQYLCLVCWWIWLVYLSSILMAMVRKITVMAVMVTHIQDQAVVITILLMVTIIIICNIINIHIWTPICKVRQKSVFRTSLFVSKFEC